MIRLFAALPAPPEIAEGLARRQHGLPGARWSPADNLHVTLRYFGEVSERSAAELDAALTGVGGAALELQLAGVGAFGEGDRQRAVWASVVESEPLRRLAARCEQAARRSGLAAERRPYRPHMTLAYLSRSPEPRVAAWIATHNLLRSPTWRASSFGLYSSWRSADGSRYELEREYPLSP